MPTMNLYFSTEIEKELKYYVYRLIDPRNGETFYIGKGKGNRVFSHINNELTAKEKEDDGISDKLSRIRKIKLDGFEVAHVIHRHGLDEKTAFEVEGALIDAYPSITNIMGGHGNNDRGVMHSKQIITHYQADEVDLDNAPHKALLIKVNKTAEGSDLYDATRYAWRVGSRAEEADIILSIFRNMIVGVFVATNWLDATAENFPGKETVDGRKGFIGKEADIEIQKKYIGKKLPKDYYGTKGAANPIKYSW